MHINQDYRKKYPVKISESVLKFSSRKLKIHHFLFINSAIVLDNLSFTSISLKNELDAYILETF